MGYKTRSFYKSGCLKNCKNRDIKCDECFKFNQLKETKEVKNERDNASDKH
jgi:predicted ATP-dependent serine protease